MFRIAKRITALLILAGTPSAAVAVAAPTLAAGPSGHPINIRASFDDSGTHVTGVDSCDPAQPGICSLAESGVGYFSGNLTAVDHYQGHIGYDPLAQSMTGEDWNTVTGSLAGCGRGTIVIHQFNFQTQPTLLDPSTGTAPLTLEWEVVKNSGTGAFTRSTGKGQATVYFSPPNPANTQNPFGAPNHGSYTGTITCG